VQEVAVGGKPTSKKVERTMSLVQLSSDKCLCLDLSGAAQGRGAYCHASSKCLFDKSLSSKLCAVLGKTRIKGDGLRAKDLGFLEKEKLLEAIKELEQSTSAKNYYKLILPELLALQRGMINSEKRSTRIRL